MLSLATAWSLMTATMAGERGTSWTQYCGFSSLLQVPCSCHGGMC